MFSQACSIILMYANDKLFVAFAGLWELSKTQLMCNASVCLHSNSHSGLLPDGFLSCVSR